MSELGTVLAIIIFREFRNIFLPFVFGIAIIGIGNLGIGFIQEVSSGPVAITTDMSLIVIRVI